MILGGPRAALGELLGGVLVLSWVTLGWSWAILLGPRHSWGRLGSVFSPPCSLGSISNRFGAPLKGVFWMLPGGRSGTSWDSLQLLKSRLGVLDALVPVPNR